MWYREYDPGTTDTAVAITVKGGYVYVTGRSKPSSLYLIATMKIDTTYGNDASGWPEVYNPGYNCEVRRVRVGSAGDVYVAGTIFHSSTTGYADFVVIKYPSSGGGTSTTYVRDIGTNTPDTLKDIVLDANDNVYITGSTKSGTNINYAMIKLSSGLSEQWASPAIYDNTSVSNGYDTPKKILVLPSGSIFVTGNSDGGSTTHADITTVKYNSSGAQQGSAARYADAVPYDYYDDVEDMTTNSTNSNIYLCGNLGEAPMIIIKYDTSLSLQWGKRLGGSTYEMVGRHIHVDNNGNSWVGGDGDSQNQWTYGNDLLLQELDANGNNTWGLGFDPTFSRVSQFGADDFGYAMATDGSGGNVYLAGSMTSTLFSNAASQDFILLKFSTGGIFSQKANFVSVGPAIEPDQPSDYKLSQNYPNPFNPTTTIRFALREAGPVSLKIYDILGREVHTLIDNEPYSQGEHEVTFNASNLSSGVYFYRLSASGGKYHELKKMMLMK